VSTAVDIDRDKVGRIDRKQVNISVVLCINALGDKSGSRVVIDGARLKDEFLIGRRLKLVKFHFCNELAQAWYTTYHLVAPVQQECVQLRHESEQCILSEG
jgi:hypothetical protein